MRKFTILIIIILILTGCTSNSNINKITTDNPNDKLLIGTVIGPAITINDITYIAIKEDSKPDRSILDTEYAIISEKQSLSNSVASYSSGDQNALLVDVGTIVYTLKGYGKDERIAVYVDNTVVIYSTLKENSEKKISLEDLQNVKENTTSIIIKDSLTDDVLTVINDMDKILHLTSLLLESTFIEDIPGGKGCSLVFKLKSGDELTYTYLYDAGVLCPNILVKDEFYQQIKTIAKLK